MNKVIVMGGGRMGRVVCWAFNKLGYKVLCYDSNQKNLDEVAKLVPSASCVNLHASEVVNFDGDAVISCLPYFCNEELAKRVIDYGVAYIDLGGDIDTDNAILRYAEEHAIAPVHCGAGLSPGLSGILAEKAISELNGGVDVIKMAVGGLPLFPDNPITYKSSWSVHGLLNNYRNRGEVLRDGLIIEESPFSNYEEIEVGGANLECFLTSGGFTPSYLKDLQNRGINNCIYQTIRYQGHAEIMKWLVDNLDDKTLVSLLTSNEPFKDVVLIRIDAWQGENLHWEQEEVIYCSEQFSAMARSTAFSIAAATKVLVEDLSHLKVAYYKDFNKPKFYECFAKLLELDG